MVMLYHLKSWPPLLISDVSGRRSITINFRLVSQGRVTSLLGSGEETNSPRHHRNHDVILIPLCKQANMLQSNSCLHTIATRITVPPITWAVQPQSSWEGTPQRTPSWGWPLCQGEGPGATPCCWCGDWGSLSHGGPLASSGWAQPGSPVGDDHITHRTGQMISLTISH